MEKAEMVKLLRARKWNEWREANREVAVDLAGVDVSGVNLAGTDLHAADLGHANLTEARLIDANLSGANLSHANLSGAKLTRADLSGANLWWANLGPTSFGATDLGGANLSAADLTRARLMEADLSGADLTRARLGGTDFSAACLSRARLGHAGCFSTHFDSTTLSGAELGGACFDGAVLANTDLSEVKGLDQIIHQGPSTIGIDTLFLSKGRIPEVFLKGAGVPDVLIEYARSLVGKGIEFYSVFISYSSRDDAFAQRLYADLQAKGVRCWFAPEDLKIGDRFRPEIDRAIRLHDRLLLVLSANSILSDWVEKEVETAFERERRDKCTVLFPIRLDNAIMDAQDGWAADIRRSRHIGDFSNWKDHDAYQKAFDRLLRDLKGRQPPAAG